LLHPYYIRNWFQKVTPLQLLTDSETHVKYPLADYALTPDCLLIIDSHFVMSVPNLLQADTGMDVLTHAIESICFL